MTRIPSELVVIGAGTSRFNLSTFILNRKLDIGLVCCIKKVMWLSIDTLYFLSLGVIGLEYASMFNVIPGSRVTVIDGRPDLLTFADKEVIQSLEYEMRQRGAR